MTHMQDRIVFQARGETGPERARSLELAYEQWKGHGSITKEDASNHGLCVYVVISDPKRETSVEHAVRFAINELKEDIAEAGGTIWDGTHVKLTMKP